MAPGFTHLLWSSWLSGGDTSWSSSSFPELRCRGLLMVSGMLCLQNNQGFLEGWLGIEMRLGPLRVLQPKGQP